MITKEEDSADEKDTLTAEIINESIRSSAVVQKKYDDAAKKVVELERRMKESEALTAAHADMQSRNKAAEVAAMASQLRDAKVRCP